MDKRIPVGYENFDDLIRNHCYYVDKTELLYDLSVNTGNKVTLFTRPRRFGKTLNMSMIESFFDNRRDSKDVFRERKIMENHPEFCAEWMNQYPTLFISLKDVEGLTFEEAYAMLAGEIASVCIKYRFLEEEENVAPADQVVFHRLMFKESSKEEIKNALKTIMRMMNAVYERPVILLIDEYDVPLAKAEAAKNKEFYHQMLDVIRGLMSISLKTNEFLKFAVITGCLQISKESIFTGVNNFACYSVTSRKFCSYFGFRQDEVEEFLDTFSLSDKAGIIKEWYDGYIFGDTEIFCPWDVVCYLSDAIDGDLEKPGNYWANTSSNSILDDFVSHQRIDAAEKFEILLNGGTIIEDISEELTYDKISESEKSLWSVLLMTGYVSKADKSSSKSKVKLKIPNAEIMEVFRDSVVARFNRILDSSKADAFITALWNKDEKAASKNLTDILWNSISYFDYGEEYYHGMLNGIFTARGYKPDSNDEAGQGRLDLRVKDRENRRILLFEFKRSKTEENLASDCEEAITQIIRKGYAKTMPEGYEYQIVYGVAFYGKRAMVKLMK